ARERRRALDRGSRRGARDDRERREAPRAPRVSSAPHFTGRSLSVEGGRMSTTLPPDMRASILEQARKVRSPDRAQTKRANAIAMMLGVATSAAMIGALGLTLGGRPI